MTVPPFTVVRCMHTKSARFLGVYSFDLQNDIVTRAVYWSQKNRDMAKKPIIIIVPDDAPPGSGYAAFVDKAIIANPVG